MKIKNCGKGVNKDAMPNELADGQWTDGLNMRFRNSCAERFRGMQTAYNTPSITPYWIGIYTTNTKRFAVYAGIGKVFADDGTTATEITRYVPEQTITDITVTSPAGVVTITVTTAVAHKLTAADSVTLSGCKDSTTVSLDGTYSIVSTPLTTTFVITRIGITNGAGTFGSYIVNTSANSTNFTGAIDDRWTGTVLNGVLVLNNGVDVPQYWNGDTSMRLRKLTGWPTGWKVDSLKAVSYFLVGVGVTRNSVKELHTVVWSDAAEPGAIPTAWTASDTNLAGDQSIVSGGGMVDSYFWNDINFIFKQDAAWAQRYISGNDVFQFSQLPGSGMLARGCGAVTPKGLVILTPGDVVLNNGLQETSLAEGRIRDWLFTTIDATYSSRAFVTTNPKYKEVWICFPSFGQTSCDKAAVWNWEDDTWAIRSLSHVTYGTTGLLASGLSVGSWTSGTDTWDSVLSSWSEDEYSTNQARLILCRTTPDIALVDTGTKDFGVAMPWLLERVSINEDDTDSVKTISKSRPLVNGTAATTFSVYHGSAQTPEATPTYGSAITFTIGTSNWANGFCNGGRYLAYKLSGTDPQPIRFRSIDIDVKGMGSY